MDPVIKSTFHYQGHTGTLTHKTEQPSEGIILARNAELRKNPGVINDLSFGRLVASIPTIMYEKALRDGFDLNSKDKDIAARAMSSYLKTPEGRACLVQGGKNDS